VDAVELHDLEAVEGFLRADPALHAYALGDLDPFFAEHVRWYGLLRDGVLRQVALLYAEHAVPTLITPTHRAESEMARLVRLLDPLLPERMECHAGAVATGALLERFAVTRGPVPHVRMALADPDAAALHALPVEVLGRRDVEELCALYAAAYPGSWFQERRLDTHRYVGIREGGVLVCVAGVHVHAPGLGVAVLGDVATHPERRGRGLARGACAALVGALLDDGCATIALNVSEDNVAAIAAYERIGFAVAGSFLESTLQRR
jgi:ribosomal protein S18 acetylase RimI-like enzyme